MKYGVFCDVTPCGSCKNRSFLSPTRLNILEGGIFQCEIEAACHVILNGTIKKIAWLLVRERTIPTERPPLIGEFSAKFCC
jgi:hypothetical protein